MSSPPVNIPASVRARLRNIAREGQEDFQRILQRYAAERLLYRIGQSGFRDHFVLKGAMLFVLWGQDVYRPTRDIDLLGQDTMTPESMLEIFRDICVVTVQEDGLDFDPESIVTEYIRGLHEQQGVRLKMIARFGQARIPLQVDIGFGDTVHPEPEAMAFPTILDFPVPHIRVYPMETVIAEKLEALVLLGEGNSRLKDFYDLFRLAQQRSFNGRDLAEAVRSTFRRRGNIEFSENPVALMPSFYQDPLRAEQWRRFLERNHLTEVTMDFISVGETLRSFLLPILQNCQTNTEMHRSWDAGGPWQ